MVRPSGLGQITHDEEKKKEVFRDKTASSNIF